MFYFKKGNLEILYRLTDGQVILRLQFVNTIWKD